VSNPVYVICNADGESIMLDGIWIFGASRKMPAVFLNESDALEILFQIEEIGASRQKLAVRKSAELRGEMIS